MKRWPCWSGYTSARKLLVSLAGWDGVPDGLTLQAHLMSLLATSVRDLCVELPSSGLPNYETAAAVPSQSPAGACMCSTGGCRSLNLRQCPRDTFRVALRTED